jgi:hypothetical protein
MSRIRGTFRQSSNIEPSLEAPLDARLVVDFYADLTDIDTWKDDNNNVWLYDGIMVSVVVDPDTNNNGLWQLSNKENFTNPSSWVKITGAGGTILPDQTGQSGKVLGTDGLNTSWVTQTGGSDDQNASEVPYDNSSSELIATNVQNAIDEIDSNNDLYKYKSGRLTQLDFSSASPADTQKATITFTTPFDNTDYAISFVGEEPYFFSFSNKNTNSITIDLNTSQSPSGEIVWIATPFINV